MPKQLNFYRDDNDMACARGPVDEQLLSVFLETDIQEDTLILQRILDDLWAVQNGHDDSREFSGNAHSVLMTPDKVTIHSDANEQLNDYTTNISHFHEVLLNWESFI